VVELNGVGTVDDIFSQLCSVIDQKMNTHE
jgi:hypothetical protein